MSKFVNIDTIMEPARIPHNLSQESMPDTDRGDSKHGVSLQSPSWTGVRSLLGTDGSLDRDRDRDVAGTGAGAGVIQTSHNPSGSSGSISSDPSSTSSLVPSSEKANDRSKAAKRQKSKEPKSYKSSI